MNLNELRTKYQNDWSDIFIKKSNQGLAHISPRAGKSRLALQIFNKTQAKNILICYPDNKIKNSWLKDIEETNFKQNITFTTYLSLHKHIKKYDYIVFDECHSTSEAQKEEMKNLLKINNNWIGLSGSLSKDTIKELNNYFKAPVIIEYNIEQAIKDGLIANYEINVIQCKLDTKILTKNSKGVMLSEKKKYDNLTYVIENLTRQGKPTFMLLLSRMRILQNSLGKINKSKEILNKLKDKRILIFTGLTKTASILGDTVHHSKNENEDEFINFTNDNSQFNHLAVVNIGKAGVTFKNLDYILLNSFDGNEEATTQKICRCLLLEENPTKIAKIFIICTNEPAELKKLKKTLQMFNQANIKYQ